MSFGLRSFFCLVKIWDPTHQFNINSWMVVVTGGVFVLSFDFFHFLVVESTFVLELSQIFLFSLLITGKSMLIICSN